MNQLDKDIKFLEFLIKIAKHTESGLLNRLTDYLNELKMFRLREMMNVKSELESYNRLQTIRQLQDQSQITKQGEV